MLKKARSPMALILALIMCVSLFSGIVLAEGSGDTSEDVWAGIVDSTASDASDASDVVTPKEGVLFVDLNKHTDVADETAFNYEYVNGKTYAVVKGVSFFNTTGAAQTYINTQAKAAETAEDFTDFTVVLAPGTYSSLELFASWGGRSSGTYATRSESDVTVGHTLTVLGPKAGVSPFDEEWNMNTARSDSAETEAVITGAITHRGQKCFTFIYDGIALGSSGRFYSAANNSLPSGTYMNIVIRNLYSNQHKAPLDFRASLDNNNLNNIRRNVTLENCFFGFTGNFGKYSSNYNAMEDFTFKNCYFKGNDNESSFHIYMAPSYMSTDTSVQDQYSDYTIEGTRFENLTNAGNGWFNMGFKTTYISDDSQITDRPAQYVRFTIDNCEFIDLHKAASGGYDYMILRPQKGRTDQYQFTITNNTFKAKDNSFEDSEVHLITPASGSDFVNKVEIENNIFQGIRKIYGGTNIAVDLSENYFADYTDTNLVIPIGSNETYTTQYLDRACTYSSSNLKLEKIGGIDVKDPTDPTLEAITGNKFIGTASVTLPEDSTAAFADSDIAATLYSDEACTTPVTSFDGLDTVYVKGEKTVDGKSVSVVYAVTIELGCDPYAGDEKYYDPAVAEKQDGAVVTRKVDDVMYSFTVGTNIFGTINETNFPADDSGVSHVYFFAQEYAGFGSITSGSFYLHGAKAGVNPNNPDNLAEANPERNSDAGETIITEGIFYVETTEKLTVDGFTFTGTSSIRFNKGEDGVERDVDFINNRSSTERDHAVNTNGFIASTAPTTNNLNIIDNRLAGITTTRELIMMRNWTGEVEGNYFSMEGSGVNNIFWMRGEKASKNNTDTTYDVTIQNNYLVGCVSAEISPAYAKDYTVTFENNTIVPLIENKPLFTILAYAKLTANDGYNYPAYFSSANIQIFDNTVVNLNNVTGAGFVSFKFGAAEENQINDANGYNDSVMIFGNTVDLGPNASYVFGVEDTITTDNVVIKAHENKIDTVTSARGSAPVLFKNDESLRHFDLGTDFATTVNGDKVNTIPDGAEIENLTAYDSVATIAAQDDATSYSFTSSPNTTVVVLNEDDSVADYNGNITLNGNITTAKIVLSPMDGKSYNKDDAITVRIIQKLATVTLVKDETYAQKFGSAEDIVDNNEWKLTYDPTKPWTTYWKAEISVIDNLSTIVAGEQFKVLDYGMYYSNDKDELAKFVADEAYVTSKVQKKNFEKNQDGLSKVYKQYSFEIYGIKSNVYRYGQFYVTYVLNGKTITTVSAVEKLSTSEPTPDA